VVSAGTSVESDVPICRTVCEPLVCSAMIVVDEPEPRVMEEPGMRIWEEMM